VVANGGIASRPPLIADLPVEEWHRMLATDLHGCSYTIKAVIGGILDRGRGVILTISSIGADRCAPRGAPYSVSKAGVNALTLTCCCDTRSRYARQRGLGSGHPRERHCARARHDRHGRAHGQVALDDAELSRRRAA
jgi:NADP-dependent 3-hydroxy acid dehydrogenase YdfG